MSPSNSDQLRALLSIVTDLERIADVSYQMSLNIDRKNEFRIYFTPQQRTNLINMFDAVNKAMLEMEKNLESDYDSVSGEKAQSLEKEINRLRDKLRKEHLKSTEKKRYNVQSGMIYNDLFSSLEKIGDHTVNVTEAILGEVT